jgi:nitrogen regulatory protein P-II 1
MSQRQITILTDVSLITCIVQRGRADEVVKAATEAGAPGATVSYARGCGVRERLGILGVAVEVEKEVITVAVPCDQVDPIFEKMYLAARMDMPGMGFMYVTRLDKAATYVPQDVIDKLSQESPTS